MVGDGLTLNLFSFQERAAIRLVDFSTDPLSKQIMLMKAPTGAGKTIILTAFVNEMAELSNDYAFVWLCPGKGDLEEQSRSRFMKTAPQLQTQNLDDCLINDFPINSTTFINWERITKKGNTAITDSERKNLFDRIAEAHRANVQFILIIDEEHSNKTEKAQSIIDAFSAAHIIRTSATVITNSRYEFYEISELDVINAGLITKAILVNEGVENNAVIVNDYDYLLELADNKRKQIAARYKELGKTIRPLVLIQFPSGKPETIEAVEKKLETMGYTYDNGLVSIWMSENKKDLPENLTQNDGIPVFLLMKQAISTGWDCPRAKILVKLRENMSEQFTIQTIGRIRRMPEACHYDDNLLDFCYDYTFDSTYKAGLLSDVDKAYEMKRVHLKNKCRSFNLIKENRDNDGLSVLGPREVLNKIYQGFQNKYSLGRDTTLNKAILAQKGYVFDDYIHFTAVKGTYVLTDTLTDSDASHVTTRQKISTHEHGIYFLHAIDSMKNIVGLNDRDLRAVFERLFKHQRYGNSVGLLNLSTPEFYAFVINNEHLLRADMRDLAAKNFGYDDSTIEFPPKESDFHIPLEDMLKYDSSIIPDVPYNRNSYEEYSSAFVSSKIRSLPEQLFEYYCEQSNDIDWVYKNGDAGPQYFSIVYHDSIGKQHLFYPDYIVKTASGETWIIETKGGETHSGEDRNIDEQVINKFNALKDYAEAHQLNWGFVRDKDNRLYINNTVFAEDMADEHWQPIADVF